MLKTGTTSLQIFLQRNKKALEEKGIGYYIPQHEEYTPMSNAGFLCWSSLFEIRGNESQRSKYDKEIASFCNYAKLYDTLILSEEYLSELGTEIPGYWETIKQNIKKMTGEQTQIDVVIFIRRQDDWAYSRWKQQVLNSFFYDNQSIPKISDFSDYLNSLKMKTLMNYDGMLQQLVKVFGHDHLIVCGYGNKQENSFDTVETFFTTTGITPPDSKKDKALNANPSITMRAVKALLLLNQSKDIATISRNNIYHGAQTFSVLYPDEHIYYPISRQQRNELLSTFDSSNEHISLVYNNGIPFFSRDTKQFYVWEDDPEQTRQDADMILKLSTLSRETALFLLKNARDAAKKIH